MKTVLTLLLFAGVLGCRALGGGERGQGARIVRVLMAPG